jgi:hypothetical protein
MEIFVTSDTIRKGECIKIRVGNDCEIGGIVLGQADNSVELSIAAAEELITALKVMIETRRPF